MYPSYPPSRPYGPRPNYTLRRVFALAVVLVVLFLGYSACSALTGDDDGQRLSAATTTTRDASTTTTVLATPLPACEYKDEPVIYDRPEDWFRSLVDVVYALPDDYLPPDLVPASEANYSAEFRIRAIIAEDLNGMRNAILEAGVPEVALLAAYRSVEDQRALFAVREAELGFEEAASGTARPGHSEHHLGTTIDVRLIGETDVDQSFGDTPTGQWLEAHSWEHGFLLTYPEGKEDVTCYKYEPWHFRYVGVEMAKRVHDSGLTLREYLWQWEVTGSEPGVPASAVTSSSTSTPSGDEGGDGGE